jgi:hypothetical protein
MSHSQLNPPASTTEIAVVPAKDGGSPRLWLTLLLLAGLWHALFLLPAVRQMDAFGFGAEYPLFIDSYALLAAGETHALGGDPFRPMVLDVVNHRPHSYSSWWFALGDLGLTRADNVWFGALCALVFAGAAAASLRPRGRNEFFWLLGVAGSVPMLLAVNRANNDTVIFALLAPVVPCLLHPSRLVRLAAPFLIAVATGLKYYPAAACMVLLAELEPRDRRFRLGLVLLLLIMTGFSVADDLPQIARTQPTIEGLHGFGAANGLELLGVPAGWRGRAGMLAGLALGCAGWFARGRDRGLQRMAGDARWLHFILGATLLAGCFWIGKSWGYRWVFALWLAPFLWRPTRLEDLPAPLQAAWRVARLAFWPALWGGTVWIGVYVVTVALGHPPGYRVTITMWSALQAACWVFCGALTVMVGAFAWDGLLGLWPGRTTKTAD